MATSISNYDLFSLLESALDEDQEVKYNRKEAEAFLDDAKSGGYHQNKSSKVSKKKKSINQNKAKDEDFDIIDDEEDDDEEKVEEEKPEPTSINLADAVVYEKFVDDLNMFRAAHSFSSKEIATELKEFHNSLTKEEKQAMHIFIKGLIHVTMMDVKGKSAKTPSDFNISIVKKGSTSKEKKKSLDNRISAERQGKKVDSNTPLQPIKIGESRQNKSSILKVLNKNKI